MGDKMRVYELAQKLGLDNKVLLERLKAAGVEAKNHLSVLDAAALAIFDGEAAPVETSTEPVVEEKIEEQRITPGIIRRRRKEVPKAAPPADEPTAAIPESAEAEEGTAAPIAETAADEQPEPVAEPVIEEPSPEPVAEKPAAAETASDASDQAKAEVEVKEPVAEVPPEPEKTAAPALCDEGNRDIP